MLSIKKPTLLLNSTLSKNNIRSMADKALENNVIFRPHFKTHQSATIGEWFRDAGVTAITVSSVSMARYFAMHGWNDITIAFPVNLPEIDEINELASSLNLNLLLESEESSKFLSRELTASCGFFIKIDTGYHRTGIEPSNVPLIDKVLATGDPTKLQFKGFLTHSGNTYHAKDAAEILRIHQKTTESLLRLKKHYQPRYQGMILSIGDTPGCSQVRSFVGVDEVRPGNFVFFDIMQFALGSCGLDDIAVALICPVVALHPSRKEAVIYGGSVHLSKEHTFLHPDPQLIFGLAFAWDGGTWNTKTLLGKVTALSQEHGIISLTQAGCNIKQGEFLAVLPVHSCLTANLMRNFYTPDGQCIETINS
jgi:D-serine deaminase-like pyridoxal phosphate-dependent protein